MANEKQKPKHGTGSEVIRLLLNADATRSNQQISELAMEQYNVTVFPSNVARIRKKEFPESITDVGRKRSVRYEKFSCSEQLNLIHRLVTSVGTIEKVKELIKIYEQLQSLSQQS